MPWELNPFNWSRPNLPMLDFPLLQSGREFVPSLDVSEDDKEVRIECELPGIEEKDIDLNLEGNVMTIEGEKRMEEESTEHGVFRSERRYGSFCRTVDLPEGLDLDNIKAKFKNGVLCVSIPKTEEYHRRIRNIPISEGEVTR